MEYSWYSYMNTGESYYTYYGLDRIVEEKYIHNNYMVTHVEYTYGDDGELN